MKKLVEKTMLGLLVLFSIAICIQFVLGVYIIHNELSFPFKSAISFGFVINVLGLVLITGVLLAAELLYRSRVSYIKLLEDLEEKLKKFRKAYFFSIFLACMAGVASLLAYLITKDFFWFIPWFITLYIIGKNFPYKITLLQEMEIENEDERRLFQ